MPCEHVTPSTYEELIKAQIAQWRIQSGNGHLSVDVFERGVFYLRQTYDEDPIWARPFKEKSGIDQSNKYESELGPDDLQELHIPFYTQRLRIERERIMLPTPIIVERLFIPDPLTNDLRITIVSTFKLLSGHRTRHPDDRQYKVSSQSIFSPPQVYYGDTKTLQNPEALLQFHSPILLDFYQKQRYALPTQ